MASTEVITKKVGACGGFGGGERDMDINGVTRIVKISVRHGFAIDAITVCFLRNGCEECTEMWGGPGGGLTEFHLQASEYIISVNGHVGIFNDRFFLIKSLKFETNMRSYGPYGREAGRPFELPAIRGQIIGFHARSGVYLDALGVYVQDKEGSVRKEFEDCKEKLKHTETEHLMHSQELRAKLNTSDELQKKLESEIEYLKNKNELLQTKLKHTKVEHLMHSQELRAELDSKDDLQKELKSKIEYLENENESLRTKLKHTDAEHLLHSQELGAELDSKNDLQKKLESNIKCLQNKNELLHTKFKHIEVDYLMHSQELRTELDYKDDLQKKLEFKIEDLKKKNELMKTKEEDLKDAIKELLQARENFVHHYEVDNLTGGVSDGGNTGALIGTYWTGTK